MIKKQFFFSFKNIIQILLCLVIFVVYHPSSWSALGLKVNNECEAVLWPHPEHIAKCGDESIWISKPLNPMEFMHLDLPISSIPKPELQTSRTQNVKILEKAMARYANRIFDDLYPDKPLDSASVPSKTLEHLNIEVSDIDTELQPQVDESYSLEINNVDSHGKRIQGTLSATTTWGVLRGLESFAQLIAKYPYEPNQWIMMRKFPLIIEDAPRYSWRGILIDTARNYLSVPFIKHIINTMAIHKLNVFHWHMIDAQSFPFESKTFPLLHEKGAYKFEDEKGEPRTLKYTHEDIKQIVDFAYERGIRVVPEIDIPGHTASWGKAYPEVLSACPEHVLWSINNIPLNPIHMTTWKIVEGLIKEIATLFPDKYIHIGGDEVELECWKYDQVISEWMRDHEREEYEKLLGDFYSKLSKVLQKNNKTMVSWQEAILNGSGFTPLNGTITESWIHPNDIQKSLSTGTYVIQAAGWYLDQQTPDKTDLHYFIEDTWKNFYENEPENPKINSEEEDSQTETKRGFIEMEAAKRILGGEMCMWGEQVDEIGFDSRVWPRGSAVAERLWSPKSINSAVKAAPRLKYHRCRLISQGIAAAQLSPRNCNPSVMRKFHERRLELTSQLLASHLPDQGKSGLPSVQEHYKKESIKSNKNRNDRDIIESEEDDVAQENIPTEDKLEDEVRREDETLLEPNEGIGALLLVAVFVFILLVIIKLQPITKKKPN